MKKIVNIFQITTIVIGVCAIFLFLIPRLFGVIPFIVLSGSMEKEIKTGAIAYVNTNVKSEEIEIGDIIAFSMGKSQVTHRVVSINEDDTFTTKGDANNTVDFNNVKFENYKGKTIFSIPYLGYILRAVQTKVGYCIIIILVIFNLIFLIFSKEDTEKKVNKKAKNKHVRE